MNPQSNQNHHQPTYRSPFLSPLTPPAAGNSGGVGGFGRNHHTNNNNTNNYHHPYSPSSFRISGSGPPPSQQQQRTPRLFNIGETPNSAATATSAASASEWNAQQVHVDLQTAGNILLQRQLKCSAKFIAELDIGLDHQHVAPDDDDGKDVTDHVGYKSTTISEDLFFPNHGSATSSNNNINKNGGASKIQYPSLFQYARTLVELGDYAYAATILSAPSSSSSSSRTTSSSGTTKFTSTSVLSPTVEIATTTSHHHRKQQQQQHTFPQRPLPNLSSFEIYLRSYALYMAGEKQKEEQILEYQRFVFVFLSFFPVLKNPSYIIDA